MPALLCIIIRSILCCCVACSRPSYCRRRARGCRYSLRHLALLKFCTVLSFPVYPWTPNAVRCYGLVFRVSRVGRFRIRVRSVVRIFMSSAWRREEGAEGSVFRSRGRVRWPDSNWVLTLGVVFTFDVLTRYLPGAAAPIAISCFHRIITRTHQEMR